MHNLANILKNTKTMFLRGNSVLDELYLFFKKPTECFPWTSLQVLAPPATCRERWTTIFQPRCWASGRGQLVVVASPTPQPLSLPGRGNFSTKTKKMASRERLIGPARLLFLSNHTRAQCSFSPLPSIKQTWPGPVPAEEINHWAGPLILGTNVHETASERDGRGLT